MTIFVDVLAILGPVIFILSLFYFLSAETKIYHLQRKCDQLECDQERLKSTMRPGWQRTAAALEIGAATADRLPIYAAPGASPPYYSKARSMRSLQLLKSQ